MNRVRFTRMVSLLIQYVPLVCGYGAILDYCKRSNHEQAWLFKCGLTWRDGKRKRSRHQNGKAFDLYLESNGKLVWDRKVYRKLHKFWEFLGGRPMLSWDIGHFE